MRPSRYRVPALLAGAIAVLFACRAVDPSSERIGQAVHDQVRVRFVDRGQGSEALVFVHGWCCDASVWSRAMDGFAGWRRIAIDLPGHGGSEKPERAYTVEFLARSIETVLRDAGVRRAVLVGHSNGAPVVRQLARDCPERVAGLVIVEGSLKPFFTDPEDVRKFTAPMRAADWKERVARDFLDPMLAPMKNAEERARIRALMLTTPQHVAVSTFEAVCDPAIWGDDPVRVPTLAFMAESPFWDDEYKAYVRRLVPDLEWHEIAGASHFVMLDAPEEFERVVSAFLRRIGFRS